MSEQRRTSRRIAVPCGCAGCRKTAAYVVVHDGRLAIEIKSRHNGAWHVSYLTVDDLDATLLLTAAVSEEAASR